MIDNYNENKWDKFELTGRITDYLEYKGISTKIFSNVRGEYSDDNSKRAGNIKT